AIPSARAAASGPASPGPGGEGAAARPLAHGGLGRSYRAGDTDLLRTEDSARRQHHATRLDVFASTPRIRAGGQASDDGDAVTALYHLLRIHGVRAGGHGRTRHDAEGLAGAERAGEDRSRRQ